MIDSSESLGGAVRCLEGKPRKPLESIPMTLAALAYIEALKDKAGGTVSRQKHRSTRQKQAPSHMT